MHRCTWLAGRQAIFRSQSLRHNTELRLCLLGGEQPHTVSFNGGASLTGSRAAPSARDPSFEWQRCGVMRAPLALDPACSIEQVCCDS